MLHKENMIKQKKGIVVEALMRIIIMVVLIWIVFNIGKKAAEAAFGGSNLDTSFNKFVEEIKKVDIDRPKEVFLELEPNTAIMGFSKDRDYECYGCGGAPKDEVRAQFKHPSHPECQDSACLCICFKGFNMASRSQPILDISCEKLQCKKLDFDVIPKVQLENLVAKKYGPEYFKVSSWQGGFLYVRDDAKGVSAVITGLPLNYERTITVFLEKKAINDKAYIGVCPALPCIQEQK